MDTYQKELPDSVKDSLNGLSRFDIFGGMTDWDDPEPHLRIDDDERFASISLYFCLCGLLLLL